ncbi:hypothetical protein KFL_001980110 [Klebsormidium nitens]|uniref:Rhodanese domain-containing protein n=1 Tax=Klebsormidium nitens TaxID=105231 RepID=A0A1Y1I5D5_KLENI|nr:hypothetical protein KFL_001980110 [Klebsormidium nitens]|eukprot:GAQ84629.1 hypothetical protein KFL_001980110 [Klebsormidium nitens]
MAAAKHSTSLNQLIASRLESTAEGLSAWRLSSRSSAANAMYGGVHSAWKLLVPGSPARQLHPLVKVIGRGLQRREMSSVPFCLAENNAVGTGPLAVPISLPSTSALEGMSPVEAEPHEYVVVNFYHLTNIADPLGEVDRQAAFMKERDFRGRIYISHQGINAQFSSLEGEAHEYRQWLQADPRFQDVPIQMARAPAHAFPRLKLRYKPDLVMVRGGTRQLPLTEPHARAVPLSPAQWRRKLDQRNGDASQPRSEVDESGSPTRQLLLLDVRNGYEWDVGHFQGAARPEVDCFRETEFGLAEGATPQDPLAGVDPQSVDVMMYCTGGIRCDVYSTMLRQQGFQNLYTLQGGVVNYLKEEGPLHWNGNLFVFDSRMSVPPAEVSLGASEAARLAARARDENGAQESGQSVSDAATEPERATGLPWASCRICGASATEPRHRNCANADCNMLFLCCPACAGQHRGCCSALCAAGPRLRPFLHEAGQYQRLHNYDIGRAAAGGPLSKRAVKRRQGAARRHALRVLEAAGEYSEQEWSAKQHESNDDDTTAESLQTPVLQQSA